MRSRRINRLVLGKLVQLALLLQQRHQPSLSVAGQKMLPNRAHALGRDANSGCAPLNTLLWPGRKHVVKLGSRPNVLAISTQQRMRIAHGVCENRAHLTVD